MRSNLSPNRSWTRLPTVLAVLLVLAVPSASTGGPTFPAPTFLPGDGVLGPAAGLQEQGAIAAGGAGSLVVWSDARSSLVPLASFLSGPFLSPGVGTMRDIYAARLDAAGNLLDVTPIVVTEAALNQGSPKVAWNGLYWLVVWKGQTGLACCPQVNIYAARISAGGEVLDDVPILVDAGSATSGLDDPTVASDGGFWAVAWRDLDTAAGIYTIEGARVTHDGTVLDPGGKVLRHDSVNSYPVGPQLVFAAGQYLLVWNEGSTRVMGQRLSSALDPFGGVFQLNTLAGSIGRNPRVATDGTNFFATWFEDRYYGWAQLIGTRVLGTGQVLDPSGIALTPAAGYTQFKPTVVWDGTQWIVAYNFQESGLNDDLFATRVSSNGTVLAPQRIPVRPGTPVVFEPWAIPLAGGGARFVWQEGDGSDADIFSTAINASGQVGPVRCVSIGSARQSQPRFASNGNGFLAVFLSEASGSSRVLGQRLSLIGSPIDAEPFEIAAGSAPFDRPSVAWDGQRYLVTWSDRSQSTVHARRLAADGTTIDAAFFVMPGNEPDVAALDGVFLVVGTRAQGEFRTLYGTRVRGADGALLDASPVVVGTTFALQPSVAAIGDRWLVAWRMNVNHDNPQSNIWANFVEPGGMPGTAFAVTATPLASEGDPCVVAGGGGGVVAWTNGSDLLARRVLPDGTMLDPGGFVVSAAPGLQHRPAAGWDGAQFTFLFGDFRNDDPNGPYVGDVYGARVAAGGSLLDPEGFPFLNESGHQEAQATVAGAPGAALLGCATFQSGAPYASYRIAYSMIGPAITDAGGPPVRGSLSVAALPNPARGQVAFAVRAPSARGVSVTIQDVQGRRVYAFSGGAAAAEGERMFHWDGRDERGVQVPAGVYFVKVDAAGIETRRKFVLL